MTCAGDDLTGRFGGDEFAILLPHTGASQARRISERLRDKIAGRSRVGVLAGPAGASGTRLS